MNAEDERETAGLLAQLRVRPSAGARERAFMHLEQEFLAQQAARPRRHFARWAVAAGFVLALFAAWTRRRSSSQTRGTPLLRSCASG